MSHSLTKIWIHSIWSTKDWAPLLKEDFRKQVFNHLETGFSESECLVNAINGTNNHVHSIFLLNSNFALAKVIKNVKGESTHWINQQNFLNVKFAWQTGYAAFSVSESILPKVKEYVIKQEEHHEKLSFKEEFEKLIKLHNLGNR